jgi:hypothetical protein
MGKILFSNIKILVFLCLITIIVSNKEVIDCNKYQQSTPYGRKKITITSREIEFNNCFFKYNYIHFQNSKITIKNSKMDSSNLEFQNSEFIIDNLISFNKCPSITDSNGIIKNSELNCISIFKLHIQDSNIEFYNSIINNNLFFYDGKLTFYQTTFKKKFIIVNKKSDAKKIKSKPMCNENHINPPEKITSVIIGKTILSEKSVEEYNRIPNYPGCEKCPKEEYSNDSKECRFCSYGSSWDKKTSSCIHCLNPKWCPTAFSCIEKHKGLGCGICSEGHFMLNYECVDCPSKTGYIIGIIIGLIVTIIIAFLFHKITTDWNDMLVIVNISINHFQILILVTDFTIKFPQFFKDFLNKMKTLFTQIFKNYIINSECLTKFDYVENYIFNMFLPFMGLIIIILTIIFGFYIKKKNDREIIKSSIIKITYTFINMLYIYNVSYSLKVFNMVKHQDAVVMKENKNIRRIDKEWKILLSFAIINAIYCIFTPILFYNKCKDNLDFLEKKLKDKFHNYEIIWETYIKKGFISICLILPNIFVSYSLIFVTLIICAIYHYINQPFLDKHKVENKMVSLFYLLNLLYTSLQLVFLIGGFQVLILSILLGLIYIISFLIIGFQLIPIIWKIIKIWFQVLFQVWIQVWNQKKKDKKINIEIE